jgi:hypothetical protein
VTTKVAPLPPNGVTGNGDGNRPEINPVDKDKIVYVGTDDHIHYMSLGVGPTSDVDLSLQSNVGSALDEHPDWSPDGTTIVFDSNRNSGIANQAGGNTIFTMASVTTTPTVANVWAALPSGQQQVEPFYAPVPGNDVTTGGHPPLLVWTSIRAGSNIIIDDGTNVNNATDVVNLTNNHTNNGEPTWEPVTGSTGVPEAPLAVGLPLAGGVVLLAAGVIGRRRRLAGVGAA